MTFGEKLRELREAANLSQGNLATRVGVPQARVSKWEANEGKPNPGVVLKLAETLGISVEELCRADTGPTAKAD